MLTPADIITECWESSWPSAPFNFSEVADIAVIANETGNRSLARIRRSGDTWGQNVEISPKQGEELSRWWKALRKN